MKNNAEDQILPGLRTEWIGKDIHFFKELISTNLTARELAEANSPDGTVVVAEIQTGGEGRLGRKWVSNPGGLWFSVILRPSIQPEFAPQLTIMAAVAVAQAIENKIHLKPGIKWPNDILINDRKVCGILTEMVVEDGDSYSVVVGIGVNVNLLEDDFDHELRQIATSLSIEASKTIDMFAFLEEILLQLEKWYTILQKSGFHKVRNAWITHNITINREVKLSSCDEISIGMALDMDEHGALLVRERGGNMKIFPHGEISLRRVKSS